MIDGIILYRNGSFRTDGESYIEDGILCLENDKTRLISATDFASLDSLKVAGTTSEGKSRLAVYCDYDDISEAIRFISDSGTSIREYRMFGEHNTDLLSPVIQSLLTGGEISMVKSVQRGKVPYGKVTAKTTTEFVYGSLTYSRYFEITVSAVSDISKCSLSVHSASNEDFIYELYNNTTIRIYFGSESSSGTSSIQQSPYNWELVEYY